MVNNTIGLVACLFGFTGVALGAFGAHALSAHFTDAQLKTWETAVFYQLVHTAVLLFISIFSFKQKAAKIAAWIFVAGIACFSGSLYGYLLLSFKPLVFLTPIGGTLLLIGWLTLGKSFLARKNS